ncbi:YggS family pyridoxal phosphate-dependent enzyme [Schleiferiaceae bacterium]|jgi:pyridoxal phosphate enzyme (YggS family)|nr:YggS family pyridoxal phosphate-dependent enzyme [Schleiferiaceae bacterium]MDA9151160.1 YggS family pyridoxal phosphate-dependent enzyme [Schleiferiaceae bacterium]MDC3353534.1 YggS family pyridoxal phosphate-dependent enzyme [Schleiferiaceae bacterium]
MEVSQRLLQIKGQLPSQVTLVAVSKTQPDDAILDAYATGHRAFGENRVQDLKGKAERLPKDIEWHMIGHVQTNKIKDFIGFVHMVHGVDRIKVLAALEKEAAKADRIVDALIQVHIAEEDSKFGFSTEELDGWLRPELEADFPHIRLRGLMGMATFTHDQAQVKREFDGLAKLFNLYQKTMPAHFDQLSMGMSGDYSLAIACGSSMIRVGTAIFGARNY